MPTLDHLLTAHGGEVVDGDTRLTPAQAETLVATVAGGLRERGVRRGDAVAWQVPNSLAAAVLTRACWRLGAVAAPVLHSFGAADVRAALSQIHPALVVELGPEAISDPAALARRPSGAPRFGPGPRPAGPPTWPSSSSPPGPPGSPRRSCTRSAA